MTVTTKAFEYLQGRGISPDTIERESAAGNIELTDKAIIAKYRHIDGKREFKQYLNLDGSKLFQKGCKPSEPYFFSCGCKTKDADKIVITEAVFDALSVVDAIPDVTGIAIGGSQLYRKLEALPHKKKIVLAFDNDEAGNQVTENAVKLLDGAYIIPWGVNDPKDLNDLLKANKRDRIKQLIDYAEWIEPEVFEREPEQSADTEAPAETTNRFLKNNIPDTQLQDKFKETLQMGYTFPGMIPKQAGLILIIGDSETFKSFVIKSLLLTKAYKSEFNGEPIDNCISVYAPAEALHGVFIRCEGWMKYHDEEPKGKFHVMPGGLMLDDPKDIADLKEYLRALDAEILCIDTLARSMQGDENSSKDMGEVIKNLTELSNELGVQIFLIHHKGKDGNKGARGSSSLRCAVDVEITTELVGERQVVLKNTKMKDAEHFPDMGFYLETASTGYADKDGNFINTLVPIYDPSIQAKNKKAQITGNAKKALEVLNEIAPEGTADFTAWRQETIKRLETKGESESALRNNFKYAKEKLLKLNKISIDNGLVYLT